jgi:hypothetical protein
MMKVNPDETTKLFSEMSLHLKELRWEFKEDPGSGTRERKLPNFKVPDNWPMALKLNELILDPQKPYNGAGQHIKGVIASINEIVAPDLKPGIFHIRSGDRDTDQLAEKLMWNIHQFCIQCGQIISEPQESEFAVGLLRIAALYHDIGKWISNDHHVSRGVHLMRDVSTKDRNDICDIFNNFNERRSFWYILRHHDIFGCMCTGEASFPSFYDMVSWSGIENLESAPNRKLVANLSYVALLNIADSDSSLFFNVFTKLQGITAVEVTRYLSDWNDLKGFLWDEVANRNHVKRELFKAWLLEISGRPECTIRRLGRLVSSCYRAVMPDEPLVENEVARLVEDELQMLHGSRFEQFGQLFARLCKVDYGLRFFYLLMKHELLDPEAPLITRVNTKEKEEVFPKNLKVIKLSDAEREQRRTRCLRRMVHRTCRIFERIVEDFRPLLHGDTRATPLLSVNMSGLMVPPETGWAICRALKENSSSGLGWISDEIGVRLYGE